MPKREAIDPCFSRNKGIPRMQLRLLKGKIHRARVTAALMDYEGSIEVDTFLLDAAGIRKYEEVNIWNLTNGERFQTYALPAKRGSGVIAVNGAAARKVQPGDEIIISAFAIVQEKEAENWTPRVVFVDEKNRVKPLAGVAQH
jgi:aspartate 1-decarboxylase